jgi:hypothetical protein
VWGRVAWREACQRRGASRRLAPCRMGAHEVHPVCIPCALASNDGWERPRGKDRPVSAGAGRREGAPAWTSPASPPCGESGTGVAASPTNRISRSLHAPYRRGPPRLSRRPSRMGRRRRRDAARPRCRGRLRPGAGAPGTMRSRGPIRTPVVLPSYRTSGAASGVNVTAASPVAGAPTTPAVYGSAPAPSGLVVR